MSPRVIVVIIGIIALMIFLFILNASMDLTRLFESLSPRGLFVRSDQTATPASVFTIATSPTVINSSDTKTFNGDYVSFSYPAEWNLEELTPVNGARNELVRLGIPGITSDQELGFYSANLQEVKPADTTSEAKITISGRNGYKWVRKGNNYTSYDYHAPGFADVGTFGIHVTTQSENKTLEQQLDQLVRTVKY